MKNFTNRALATAFAVSLILGSGSVAFADRGGNGHGNGQTKTHAKASEPAKSAKPAKAVKVHHTDTDNDNDNDRNKDNDSKARGNSATAHSCVNPAGNTRGWCKSHAGGNYITGTVTAINGSTATVALSNSDHNHQRAVPVEPGPRPDRRTARNAARFVAERRIRC